MKKSLICLLLLFMLFSTGFMKKHNGKQDIENENNMYNVTMKQDILSLMMGYPEYIETIKKDEKEKVYLVMKSGKSILYDDKKDKNFQEKLNNPDIQDMMEQVYILDNITKLMNEEYNPGRIRVYKILKDVYGNSKHVIESNLVNVKVNYKNYSFNKNNNAATSLKNAIQEINCMCKNNGNVYSCIYPANGTFNYRVIAGTNRLSPHSFGTAIDLKSNKSDYWKWTSRIEGEKRLNSYPREVVKIFENNNFIWGGKWGKFDILHFEYRPEIIIKARYFKNKELEGKKWYYGAPYEKENVKKCIKLIDEKLK